MKHSSVPSPSAHRARHAAGSAAFSSARALARFRRIQRRIERFYELERGPDVGAFVQLGRPGSRETVLVRPGANSVELAVVLPPDAHSVSLGAPSDAALQAIEGISHFVYLAERARTELPATRLELELQAEIDKFVLFAFRERRVEPERAKTYHDALYTRVRHLHPPESEAGARYRLANDLAARLSRRLLDRGNRAAAWQVLRRFYRSGQAEKIRLASA